MWFRGLWPVFSSINSWMNSRSRFSSIWLTTSPMLSSCLNQREISQILLTRYRVEMWFQPSMTSSTATKGQKPFLVRHWPQKTPSFWRHGRSRQFKFWMAQSWGQKIPRQCRLKIFATLGAACSRPWPPLKLEVNRPCSCLRMGKGDMSESSAWESKTLLSKKNSFSLW